MTDLLGRAVEAHLQDLAAVPSVGRAEEAQIGIGRRGDRLARDADEKAGGSIRVAAPMTPCAVTGPSTTTASATSFFGWRAANPPRTRAVSSRVTAPSINQRRRSRHLDRGGGFGEPFAGFGGGAPSGGASSGARGGGGPAVGGPAEARTSGPAS